MNPKALSVFIGALAATLLLLVANALTDPTNIASSFVSGTLCCVAVIGAGLVAVWHYTASNDLTLAGGEGAGMGAAAGALSAVLAGVLVWALTAAGIFPDPDVVMQEMLDSMPADQREMAEKFGGGAGMGPAGILINALVSAVIGAIGGALGAAVFKKGGPDPTVSEPGY